MTSQPADVARAGTEKWRCCPKCEGSQILASLLSLEHRLQEARPGSKHRYDWDVPGDARWPLNLLVGGHLTLKRVTELSQKDHKELPGIERSLHSVLLLMDVNGRETKQRLMEGVFVKLSQFRCWCLTVLFLPRKKYEDVMGVPWDSLLNIAWDMQLPFRLACTKICRQMYIVTSIGFQNLPRHREVVTLPNERLDSQHDERQFSECHLEQPKVFGPAMFSHFFHVEP